jgi:hypothetical protein
MKLLPGLILLLLPGSGLLAQTASSGGGDLFAPSSLDSPSPSPTPDAEKKPAAGKAGAAASPSEPTVIDSVNMNYDGKTRVAIFTGENYGVFVKDPRFTVYCDKLTAQLRKASGPAPGIPGKKPKSSPTPTPTPSPAPKGKADAAAAKSGGLESAVAEGTADEPVVIVQDKPPSNGEAAQHSVGIALKADYDADSGNVKLSGWPRVTQGINTQIATSPKTIMIMNKDSNAMTTIGPSRTVIQEESQPKKSGTNADTSDSSPSPSAQ